MLSCRSCKSEILPSMKYAVNKNACPFCGGKIMSDEDIFDMKSIARKLENLECITTLNKSIPRESISLLINELSMFFNFALRNDEEIASVQSRIAMRKNKQETTNEKDEIDEESEKIRIRREVESDFGLTKDDLDDSSYGDEEEDSDDRVERLKRLHKKASDTILKGINKPIRRIE